RAEPVRRGDEGDRMRDRERGDDPHQWLEATEGNDQAQQEEEVVDAVEDVEKARPDEARGRLRPARVEPHQAGIALELEGAPRAPRRQETQPDGGLCA